MSMMTSQSGLRIGWPGDTSRLPRRTTLYGVEIEVNKARSSKQYLTGAAFWYRRRR